MVKQIAHPDFARRMVQACDGNTNVPLPNYGRLGWFVKELEKLGAEVTQETIRKWFAGEARPRPKMLAKLAQVLKVDEAWLSVGKTPELSEKEAKVRNASADGVVNLVAGMIQMCGGRPAFPLDDDKFAQKNKVDLYAIIRGAQYPFHVVLVQDGKAVIPTEAKDAFVLGVQHIGEIAYKLFELDWEGVEAVGRRKGGAIEVELADRDWKPVTSFNDRL